LISIILIIEISIVIDDINSYLFRLFESPMSLVKLLII